MASNDTPTHRMSAEDRRRQLIEVAIDLFSRKGFDGTTTKEIAARTIRDGFQPCRRRGI